MSSPARYRPAIRAVLAALALATTSHAHADTNPRVATFKDWALVCDNVRRCEARSLTPGANATISVIRDGGPNQSIRVRIAARGGVSIHAMDVDDIPSALADLDWQADADPPGQAQAWALTGPDAVQAVALLRPADVLTLAPGDEALSLAGMTAALLAMEDHQGRLDTSTAIIRQGPLADTRAWPASPLPVVQAVPFTGPAPSPAQIAAARESRANDQHWQCPITPDDPHDLGFAMTEREAMVFVECERRPMGSLYIPLTVRHDESRPPERLIMTMVAHAHYLQLPGVPTPQVDAASGTLVMGESDADGRCGVRGTWRFDGEFFNLAEYTEQQVCAGVPHDWPVWYRARVSSGPQ